MTGHTTPVKFFSPWDTRTTVMEIHDTSANFMGDVTVSGAVSVKGRITTQLGTVLLSQSATVAANATAAVTVAALEANTRILNIYATHITNYGTAGATINVLIGDGTDDDVFATITNASGRAGSIYDIGTGVCGRELLAGGNVLVKTTAASGALGSATNAGLKLFTTVYTRTA